MTAGEIWFAWVPYNDVSPAGPTACDVPGKRRPVVILGWSVGGPDSVVLVVPVTSFGGTNNARGGDIRISDSQLAGLEQNKTSYVRARRLCGLNPKALDRRGSVGRVSSTELDEIFKEVASLLH